MRALCRVSDKRRRIERGHCHEICRSAVTRRYPRPASGARSQFESTEVRIRFPAEVFGTRRGVWWTSFRTTRASRRQPRRDIVDKYRLQSWRGGGGREGRRAGVVPLPCIRCSAGVPPLPRSVATHSSRRSLEHPRSGYVTSHDGRLRRAVA